MSDTGRTIACLTVGFLIGNLVWQGILGIAGEQPDWVSAFRLTFFQLTAMLVLWWRQNDYRKH